VTGLYVARAVIVGLLDAQVNATEVQMTDLTTAVMEGLITVAVWQEQVRTEVKRQVLQQTALGSGGWDRISQAGYGRAGADLRQLYAQISGTARDISHALAAKPPGVGGGGNDGGKITMAQAQARANEYAGHGRSHFYVAERETVKPSASNMMLIERRMLGAGGKTCKDCVSFYGQGWQPLGVLPPPGVDSVCRGNCKCRLVRMEVDATTVAEWIGTKK
jgi:hypothetical protein